MAGHTYDDKLLTDYLLGSLSVEETEQLDQLSFTDDELAARLQVVEDDLVDAYAKGELSAQTLERFKSYYLASPKRREKVAFAKGFQNFLDRSVIQEEPQRRDSSETSGIKGPSSPRSFPYRYLFIPSPTLQWGLAAAALIAIVVGGWMVVENQRLQNRMAQAQAEREELQKREQELETQLANQRSSDSEKERELASLREQIARLEQQLTEPGAKPQTDTEPNIVAFTLAPQMRGAGQITRISVPADADLVALQLELEPNDFTSYRAELRASPGGNLWRSGRLRAKARGDGKAIDLRLRAALLKPQVYNLEVYGISPTGAAEIISSYPFRVDRQ
jgi:hypothetical protein